MTLALRSPDLPEAVVAVDNAPVKAKLNDQFPRYCEGMQKLERLGLSSQADADNILSAYEEVR